MTIVVTGATGQFGRLAVEALLRRGVPAGEIVATGLALNMLGATVVHVRRREPSNAAVTLVLAALAAFVAVMRFGPNAF